MSSTSYVETLPPFSFIPETTGFVPTSSITNSLNAEILEGSAGQFSLDSFPSFYPNLAYYPYFSNNFYYPSMLPLNGIGNPIIQQKNTSEQAQSEHSDIPSLHMRKRRRRQPMSAETKAKISAKMKGVKKKTLKEEGRLPQSLDIKRK